MLMFRCPSFVLFMCSFLTSSAWGQAIYTDWPASRIEAFEVSTKRHLVPGAILRFSVFGLPEGQALVSMVGASHNVLLAETDPGHYQGNYTLAYSDHVTPQSRITVALRSLLGVASVQLEGTLENSETEWRRKPHDLPLPLLGHLQITPASAPTSGTRLKFLLNGAPAGAASISISGLGPTILLSEIHGSGHYFGTYTMRDYDNVTAFSVVSVALRVAHNVNRVSLGQYFQQVTAPMPLLSDIDTPARGAVAQGAGMP